MTEDLRQFAGGELPEQFEFATATRQRLAHAVRHLVDATLTSEEWSDDALADAAQRVEALTSDLTGATPGSRPAGRRTRVETEKGAYLARSPIVGPVSALAPPFAYEFLSDRVVMRGEFHSPYEGPPGYVHGGWIALTFDEALGMANIVSENPGMTGRLAVKYRRPTPLYTPIEVVGWTEAVDGRRVVARGTMSADGEVTAEAEGLFVKLDVERAMKYFGANREYEGSEEPSDPLP